MCGNGARAVARFLYESGLVEPDQPINLITKSNQQIIVQAVKKDGKNWYQVNMGQVSSVGENQKPFQGLLGEGFDGNLEKFDLEELILCRELNKLIQEIYNSAKGLICPDYLPENYEKEGRILPGCPIATDEPKFDPFEVLSRLWHRNVEKMVSTISPRSL